MLGGKLLFSVSWECTRKAKVPLGGNDRLPFACSVALGEATFAREVMFLFNTQ